MAYLTVEIDQDMHRVLADLASQNGQRVAQVVAELLRLALDSLEQESLDLRLWQAAERMRRRAQRLACLQEIALNLPYASAAEQEEFSRLCAEAGFAEEEVLASVQHLDARIIVADDGRRLLSAINAMRDLLRRSGGTAPAAYVERELRMMGFSSAVIKTAKAELGIRSIRLSDRWVWELP